MTQQSLARLIGVSQAHIAKVELDKVDPRLSTVNKILEVLTEGKKIRCKNLMSGNVIFARPSDSVLKVSQDMMKHAISQIPVLLGNRVVGTITEESIIRNLSSDIANKKVKRIMGPPLPIVSDEAAVQSIRPILKRHQGVLVEQGKDVVGIITRSDLLKTIG